MRNKLFLAALGGLIAITGAHAQQPPEEASEPAKLPKRLTVAQPIEAFLPPALTPENTLLLDLSTGGQVKIQLRPDKAPGNVARVKTLAQQGFYNGLTFHRVIEGFMAQGGDPKGDGTGGSPLPDLKAEFNDMPHVRGVVAMARSQQPDSANSQFFIMLAPNLSLDNNYTAIGRVVSGMAHVDALERGEPPTTPSRIVRASLGAPFTVEAAAALPVAAPVPATAPPAAAPAATPPAATPAPVTTPPAPTPPAETTPASPVGAAPAEPAPAQ